MLGFSVQPLLETKHWVGQRGQFLSEEGRRFEPVVVEDTNSVHESWINWKNSDLDLWSHAEMQLGVVFVFQPFSLELTFEKKNSYIKRQLLQISQQKVQSSEIFNYH